MKPDLPSLQTWLQTAITTPWQIEDSGPETMIKNTGPLSASDRLGIYTRAYQGRLVECMTSEFPVLHLALGAELFIRFATDYLIKIPPASYTLTLLGQRFPEHLAETRPPDPPGTWPDFIIDLARLERSFTEVYHRDDESASAGIELSSAFPIDHYFIAARNHLKSPGEFISPDFPNPDQIRLLVFREDSIVKITRS